MDCEFPPEELGNRMVRLRAAMERQRLEGLVLTGPENIFRATGRHTPRHFAFQAFFVPLDRDPFLIVRHVVLDLCTKISVVSSTDLLSSERLLQLNLVDGRQGRVVTIVRSLRRQSGAGNCRRRPHPATLPDICERFRCQLDGVLKLASRLTTISPLPLRRSDT